MVCPVAGFVTPAAFTASLNARWRTVGGRCGAGGTRRSGVHVAARRREHPLPAELPVRVGVLPRQGERQLDAPGAVAEIPLVEPANPAQVGLEREGEPYGQQGDAVFAALAVPLEQLVPAEVDVLHPELAAL
jgi:hypothetical protein